MRWAALRDTPSNPRCPLNTLAFRRVRLPVVLALATFVLLNANGREIGSYDSQPTKFAACELARHGTLCLDRVIALTPALGQRPAFAQAIDGHVRSAYPVLPSLIAAAPAWVMGVLGLLDLDAPLAPTIVAKLTASLLVAVAVVLAFLIARRRISTTSAVLLAIGYGLGTNVWAAGQTLGGHESVAVGLTGALLVLASPGPVATGWPAWSAMAMLAVAGAARPQIAPAVAILALGFLARSGFRRWWPLSVLLVAGTVAVWFNLQWFGHPLGAVPRLEALHATVHASSGTFNAPWRGAVGLLLSPSRGLLIFSPVVLLCLPGVRPALREGWRGPLLWCLAASICQFALYASYTVWWGGHSYGPRYALDALPPLIPLAAAGAPTLARHRLTRLIAVAALAWSVLLAATGAFSYPAERWNTDPAEVDLHHERLWDWKDPQFVRCWTRGLSPQDFDLFHATAFHR